VLLHMLRIEGLHYQVPFELFVLRLSSNEPLSVFREFYDVIMTQLGKFVNIFLVENISIPESYI